MSKDTKGWLVIALLVGLIALALHLWKKPVTSVNLNYSPVPGDPNFVGPVQATPNPDPWLSALLSTDHAAYVDPYTSGPVERTNVYPDYEPPTNQRLLNGGY